MALGPAIKSASAAAKAASAAATPTTAAAATALAKTPWYSKLPIIGGLLTAGIGGTVAAGTGAIKIGGAFGGGSGTANKVLTDVNETELFAGARAGINSTGFSIAEFVALLGKLMRAPWGDIFAGKVDARSYFASANANYDGSAGNAPASTSAAGSTPAGGFQKTGFAQDVEPATKETGLSFAFNTAGLTSIGASALYFGKTLPGVSGVISPGETAIDAGSYALRGEFKNAAAVAATGVGRSVAAFFGGALGYAAGSVGEEAILSGLRNTTSLSAETTKTGMIKGAFNYLADKFSSAPELERTRGIIASPAPSAPGAAPA